MTSQDNIDTGEVSRFDSLARTWWDREGDFRTLHDINPLRLDYIAARCELVGKRAIDVGCGGGILTESLARAGARVTGIDMGEKTLQVARLHMYESGLDNDIEYVLSSVESFAEAHAGEFDVVTCMELLEHVPDPASVVGACRTLLKPGGQLFLSTINRNPKAYALMVLGAEYILRMVPRGTHDYARFIKPAELARWLREAGFTLSDVTGMTYNPLSRTFRLSRDTDVNYLAYASIQ